ncbi:hypothetical protein ACQEVC_35020 [Plantactinospora sp. CA-294935]|uniref:hypothetical protein n=1 Tax=Plantactinospora sp. CA-294935 TaxID=3240012 RepID=UPI003D8E6436
MTDAIVEFFAWLSRRRHEPQLENVTGGIRRGDIEPSPTLPIGPFSSDTRLLLTWLCQASAPLIGADEDVVDTSSDLESDLAVHAERVVCQGLGNVVVGVQFGLKVTELVSVRPAGVVLRW